MDEIGELCARVRVADLVHAYALAIRRGQPGECRALFTDNAIFEVRYADPLEPKSFEVASRSEGIDEVIASITRSTANVRMFPYDP